MNFELSKIWKNGWKIVFLNSFKLDLKQKFYFWFLIFILQFLF